MANPAVPLGTGPCTVPVLGGSCQAPAGTSGPHMWSPEWWHECVTSPCLPHVGVCSQPAPASQHFMDLWLCSVLLNADVLSVPADVL